MTSFNEKLNYTFLNTLNCICEYHVVNVPLKYFLAKITQIVPMLLGSLPEYCPNNRDGQLESQ